MEKRMLMISVPLGKAERVVQLANQAGASGATILHTREALPEPKSFQLEPQRDLVLIVTNLEFQKSIEESIRGGFEQAIKIYCVPIFDSVGLEHGGKTISE
jgi:hypothetical protein